MVNTHYGGIKEPDCFGDDTHFSETSNICRVCPFRDTCQELIQQSVNIRSIKDSTMTRSSWQTSSSTRTRALPAPVQTTHSRPNTATTAQHRSHAMIRPAKFNMNKPIIKQLSTYVALDVATSIANRSIDLLEAIRIDYEKGLIDGD